MLDCFNKKTGDQLTLSFSFILAEFLGKIIHYIKLEILLSLNQRKEKRAAVDLLQRLSTSQLQQLHERFERGK